MNDASTRILIVDDNPAIREVLRLSLTEANYSTIEAVNGRDCLRLVDEEGPDLILLDLGLPDIEGAEIVRRLRNTSSIPIIIVSARALEKFKVEALDLGADDYLTKPFGIQEMLARVRAALRHSIQEPVGQSTFESQTLKIDFALRRVWAMGAEVHLSPREYKLLSVLVKHAGKLMTHRQLLEQVWGSGHAEDHHYLRVYMRQLRQKLEADPSIPRLILNEPGVGYRLAG